MIDVEAWLTDILSSKSHMFMAAGIMEVMETALVKPVLITPVFKQLQSNIINDDAN